MPPKEPFIAKFTPEIPPACDSYNYETQITIYDNLGQECLMTLYFIKLQQANTWQVYTAVDGHDVTPCDETDVQPHTLKFNELYKLQDTSVFEISFNQKSTKAPKQTVSIDLSPCTQYKSCYFEKEIRLDGMRVGKLSHISVNDSLDIKACYDNQLKLVIGELKNIPAVNHLYEDQSAQLIFSTAPKQLNKVDATLEVKHDDAQARQGVCFRKHTCSQSFV
jgi:flagellar hook protein FlgE